MPQTVPGFDRLTVEADKLGGQACVRQNLPRIEQIITEHGNSRRTASVIAG